MQTYTIEPSDIGTFVHIDGKGYGFWATDEADARREIALLQDPAAVLAAHAVEERDVTEDYCFICSRVTDHRGEHSMQSLLARQ